MILLTNKYIITLDMRNTDSKFVCLRYEGTDYAFET